MRISLVLVALVAFLGAAVVTADNHGMIKVRYKKFFVSDAGKAAILAKNITHAVTLTRDTVGPPADPNDEYEPDLWRPCSALCTNKNLIRQHCNAHMVVDFEGAPGVTTSKCVLANLDIDNDVVAYASDQDVTLERPTPPATPTQWRVNVLSVFDVLHNP